MGSVGPEMGRINDERTQVKSDDWSDEPILSRPTRIRLAHGPEAESLHTRHLVAASLKASVKAARSVFLQVASLINVKDPRQVLIFSSSHEDETADLLEEILQLLREKFCPKLMSKIIFKKLCTDDPLYAKHTDAWISLPPSRGIESVQTLSSLQIGGQRVPSGSLHLTLSMEEVKWPSKPMVFLESQLPVCSPQSPKSSPHTEALQAALDWERFLYDRAEELRPGGCLLVTSPCRDPSIALKGYSESQQQLREMLEELWEGFLDNDRISQDEFRRARSQSYARSKQELLAPFEIKDGAVTRAGLALAECTMTWHDHQPRQAWRAAYRQTGKDERETFVADVITLLRWCFNGVFLAALNSRRPLRERETIVDDLFEMMRRQLLSIWPEDLKCGVLLGHVIAVKRL